MKGKRKRTLYNSGVFKVGNSSWRLKSDPDDSEITDSTVKEEVQNAGVACKNEFPTTIRMDEEVYNDTVIIGNDGIPHLPMPEVQQPAAATGINPYLLRPRRLNIPQGSQAGQSKGELESYRIVHLQKTADLWNDAFFQHTQFSSQCPGKLMWDMKSSKQWGLGWQGAIACNTCKYKSTCQKLYNEVINGKAGRNHADVNLALQVGLSHTSISTTATRIILAALNMPAPSASGMQRNANTVGNVIVQTNQSDMIRIRSQLKDQNVLRGLEHDSPINVEGDGRYNNPLYSSLGKTPYQPATQAVYTISENLTPKKKIIAVSLKNKLCRNAELLRSKGGDVTCPDHAGVCTANIAWDAPIGNEREMAAECVHDLVNGPDSILIDHFTGDGDSAAFKGVERAQEMKTDIKPKRLSDGGHLTRGMYRFIKAQKFSDKMFGGNIAKSKRDKRHGMFALELSRRCDSEFKAAFRKYGKNTPEFIKEMKHIGTTIIDCYRGDCSNCESHSFVCGGPSQVNGRFHSKMYLTEDFHINPLKEDTALLLTAISKRLGEGAIMMTKFNTSTQKSEANNRGFNRTNPKNVTFSRNFPARIHSEIHTLNSGIGKSTITQLKAVGTPLPMMSKARTHLLRMQSQSQYIAKRLKTAAAKKARSRNKMRRYHAYKQNKEDELYRKGMADEEWQNPGPSNSKDHCYSRPKPRSKSQK